MRNLLVVALLALVACSSNGGETNVEYPFPSISGDLHELAAALPVVPEGSAAYTPPSQEEREDYRSALISLLEGDTDSAAEGLESIGMEIVHFTDASGPDFFLIRDLSSPARGWGLYAINTKEAKNLLIEAPHPTADLHTGTQAADLFLALPARGLLVAGAHRCASLEASACSGTTSVCSVDSTDEPYRTSDAAHDVNQIYQITHEVLMDSDASLVAVALHGFSAETGDPEAYVSNGTDLTFNETSVSNRFASRFNTLTGLPGAAMSCNAGSPESGLCGTEDVQGRYTNGSPNACTEATATASGRFLHIEQSLELRTEGGPIGPGDIRNALEDLF